MKKAFVPEFILHLIINSLLPSLRKIRFTRISLRGLISDWWNLSDWLRRAHIDKYHLQSTLKVLKQKKEIHGNQETQGMEN